MKTGRSILVSVESDPPGSHLTAPRVREPVTEPAGAMVELVSEFTDSVSIRVRQKFFQVPRDILTRDSAYFAEVLNQDTPRKFFLVLDDVEAERFNMYINVLFKSFFVPNFKLRSLSSTSAAWPNNIKLLLRLWQLSSRFRNPSMCALAEDALNTHFFAKFTTEKWEKTYIHLPVSEVRVLLSKLQKGYTICVEDSIPFAHHFVTAGSKCPAQVLATCFDHLGADFQLKVAKSFAARNADPALAERKRAWEGENPHRTSQKKQRRTATLS